MKKFFAVSAALLFCAAIFTACGSAGEIRGGAPAETVSAAVSEAPETAAVIRTETAKETTAAETETEAETKPAKTSYSSLKSFATSHPIEKLKGDTVKYDDSLINKFIEGLGNGDRLYIDTLSYDGSASMAMFFEEPSNFGVRIKGTDPKSGVDMTILLKGSSAYMLDNIEKTGFSFEATEENMSSVSSTTGMLDVIDSSGEKEFTACTIEIGGKSLEFEFNEETGFLFDGDTPCAIIFAEASAKGLEALAIKDFSANIPKGAFDVPSGYKIVDITALSESLGEE